MCSVVGGLYSDLCVEDRSFNDEIDNNNCDEHGALLYEGHIVTFFSNYHGLAKYAKKFMLFLIFFHLIGVTCSFNDDNELLEAFSLRVCLLIYIERQFRHAMLIDTTLPVTLTKDMLSLENEIIRITGNKSISNNMIEKDIFLSWYENFDMLFYYWFDTLKKELVAPFMIAKKVFDVGAVQLHICPNLHNYLDFVYPGVGNNIVWITAKPVSPVMTTATTTTVESLVEVYDVSHGVFSSLGRSLRFSPDYVLLASLFCSLISFLVLLNVFLISNNTKIVKVRRLINNKFDRLCSITKILSNHSSDCDGNNESMEMSVITESAGVECSHRDDDQDEEYFVRNCDGKIFVKVQIHARDE